MSRRESHPPPSVLRRAAHREPREGACIPPTGWLRRAWPWVPSSCRWTFLLEMVFVVLPSPLPNPEAAAHGLAGWGWEQSVGRGFGAAPHLGLPALQVLFPTLTSWAFSLISSHTWASGSQLRTPSLFPACLQLLRRRWSPCGLL